MTHSSPHPVDNSRPAGAAPPLRYLFGPVSHSFAEQNLQRYRAEGLCLAFNSEGTTDLAIRPGDSWDTIQGRLPADWRPDYLVLNLAYSTVPECLWTAPLVRVGLATDWNLLWHHYRRCLPNCDLILTDAPGQDTLRREGLGAVWTANLCGCERLFVELSGPTSADERPTHRDIDVLFLGNINAAVQKERMPWLGRLARLSSSRRVLLATGVFGENCLRLLQRSRIVFQFSGRGKLGRRSFEAAAAGALILQEADNRELFHVFTPHEECIPYRAADLERLLEHYLDQEDERQRLAEAAHGRVGQFTFEHLWGEVAGRIAEQWSGLRDRGGTSRLLGDGLEALHRRCWQALGSLHWDDTILIRDLERSLKDRAAGPWLRNALGVLLARQTATALAAAPLWDVAVDCFRAAARHEFVLADLNLAQAFDAARQRPLAIETARQTLSRVLQAPSLDSLSREGLPLCQGFDGLRVEWERAGFSHAGQPEEEARVKRRLILWQLYTLLARWTGEVEPAYEAALLQPDQGVSRVALGEALRRAGRSAEAAEHLRQALETNPLDREAAHACFLALDAAEDREGQRRLCADRRLVAHAAPALVPVEPWFAEPKPRGNELVSILVLCGDDAENTRRSLETLPRYSRPPYDLILVESSPESGARAALQEFRTHVRSGRDVLGWGPERTEFIAHEPGRGFTAGVNQGLRQARGRYVVFLSDDTLVTPGWLEALVKWSLHEWPTVGLVGPTINGAPEPQGLREGPVSLDDVNTFAARRRRAYADAGLFVPRLTGSCLLARREVLERIGGLDERFGTGLFADDDWCFRAREAGWRSLLARDLYLHRCAGGAFHALGAATRERLGQELEVFRAKWGPEWTAGYALPPEAPPLAAPRPDVPAALVPVTAEPAALVPVNGDFADRPRVTLCMIVKNEEHHLPDCLRSVVGLPDEIIVVDTGSADRTRDVAREFGAEVFDFPWPDSFGRARNESLGHARGKWILWLDADDRLDAENRERLKEVLAGLGDERDAYAMKVRSVLDAERTGFRLLDQVRLFRNLPEIRWDYRIHEQILPAVNRAGGGIRWAPVTIDHVGYVEAETRRKKLERNLRLLEMDGAERPDDSFSLFNLGWTLLDLGRAQEGQGHLQRSLDGAAPQSSILRKLYHLLGVCHRNLGRPGEALKILQQGLGLFPDDGEMLLDEGLLLRDQGDFVDAERSWLKLLTPRQGNYFASEEVGLRGYKTRQLLAEIYARQERWLEAEVQCRASLAERADFEPAWLGLAEIQLRQGRESDLENLLQRLEQQGAPAAKLAWLRGRGQVQRREFARARQSLEKAIALDPRAIGPRVLLSHALLQEGRDWTAAEQALHDVLELDAQNQEAQHNLQLLQRQRPRTHPPLAAGAV